MFCDASESTNIYGGEIVESRSAVLDIPHEEQCALEEDHRSMVCFPKATKSYDLVLGAIKKMLAAIRDDQADIKAKRKRSAGRGSTDSSLKSSIPPYRHLASKRHAD
jgi:hypothetical protein